MLAKGVKIARIHRQKNIFYYPSTSLSLTYSHCLLFFSTSIKFLKCIFVVVVKKNKVKVINHNHSLFLYIHYVYELLCLLCVLSKRRSKEKLCRQREKGVWKCAYIQCNYKRNPNDDKQQFPSD